VVRNIFTARASRTGAAPEATESAPTKHAPAKKAAGLFLAFLMVATAGGVVASGAALPLAFAGQYAANTATDVLNSFPSDLVRGPLAQPSTIHAANGDHLATFFVQNRIEVPLENISEHMINAVIAIEDERFFEHPGVDLRSIARAFTNNLRGGNLQGASTITQQYVKNRLIDAAYHEGDPFGVLEATRSDLNRKAAEARLAVALEQEISKEEILQGYLNLAQFGHRNIFGVEAAARFFFNTTAQDLTPVQAATIAGVTNRPGTFDPTVNPEASQRRRNIVLHQMYSLGYITREEFDEARLTPVADTLDITPVPVGCQAAENAAFFCDFVVASIRNSPAFGETVADRVGLLNRGGLRITTTLDVDMQNAAVEELNNAVPVGNSANLDAAIVSVEPGTGKIRAMAQNVPFDPRSNAPEGTTAVNFSAGPAHGSSRGFQTGSVFKNFVLVEWLRQGNTLLEHVNANQVSRPLSAWTASCMPPFAGEIWSPGNVDGARAGMMSVLTASYASINTAFADMSTRLDLCDVRDTAWDMGFRPTSARQGGALIGLEDPSVEDIEVSPAMILGTQTTSPLQVAASHATLASGGTYCEPYAITAVVDPSGTELEVPGPQCTEAIESNVAATVNYALEQTLTRGTATNARLAGGRPAAGKTGTSQGASQTWFVGYTPQLSTAVWVGNHTGERSHFNINLNGQWIRTLFGSTVAAPLWRSYMNRALEGLEHVAFDDPDPDLIGQAPPPPQPRFTDWFRPRQPQPQPSPGWWQQQQPPRRGSGNRGRG